LIHAPAGHYLSALQQAEFLHFVSESISPDAQLPRSLRLVPRCLL
jgi:hypothetical protein